MINREQALAFILQHRKIAERDFIELAKELFRKHDGVLPPEIRAKFLQAGGSYGEFRVDQDWHAEMEAEIWDGVLYAGLQRLKHEFIDPASHVPPTAS